MPHCTTKGEGARTRLAVELGRRQQLPRLFFVWQELLLWGAQPLVKVGDQEHQTGADGRHDYDFAHVAPAARQMHTRRESLATRWFDHAADMHARPMHMGVWRMPVLCALRVHRLAAVHSRVGGNVLLPLDGDQLVHLVESGTQYSPKDTKQ